MLYNSINLDMAINRRKMAQSLKRSSEMYAL